MKTSKLIKAAQELIEPYRVTKGSTFRLRDFNPADTGSMTAADKPKALEALESGVKLLAEMQERLYADDRWSLLLVFQAMDAAGKDSAIKHVMSGVNPQGCEVHAFKAPTSEELDHDFLWRCAKRLPERGRIGIFNRSYYEETLVVRVHPEILGGQKLPASVITKDIWTERFEDIRSFENHLTRSGTVVRKFFLNVSKAEQKKRFLERLNEPEKHWKFSPGDVKERGHWAEYMKAYEETIRATATKESPWLVIPADQKWFTRIVVAAAVIDALAGMDLKYPTVTAAMRAENESARKLLLSKSGG